MKIPETYEEFLALSENELDNISKSDMSLQDAQKMMKFFDRFDMDYQNKPLTEVKRKTKQSEKNCMKN